MKLPLEDPSRLGELRARIAGKPLLHDWYETVYLRWALAARQAPAGGRLVELGSGAGFAADFLPGLWRTDFLPYLGMNERVDAARLPWADSSVGAIFLLNVLHHLPDAPAFLAEADRVLMPGGLLVVSDQQVGPISRVFLGLAHHEPFDPAAKEWTAASEGALAGANGALAWMIFRRDLERFRREYPRLELLSWEPFAPLQYWLSGGLRPLALLPGACLPLVRALDRALLRLSPSLGSFAHAVLRKT